MSADLAMWGIFTAVMFLGTFWLNRALQFVFGTLTVLFFLLAIGDYTGTGRVSSMSPAMKAPSAVSPRFMRAWRRCLMNFWEKLCCRWEM